MADREATVLSGGQATMTNNITQGAHRLRHAVPVLGAEYIGEVANGVHVEWFEARKCPEGLGELACDAETRKGAGIHKGTYHWMAWVLQMRCPHCKASGFKALESRRPGGRTGSGPPCIVCGKCGRVLEVYRMEHPGLTRRGDPMWNKRVTA